MITAHIIHLFPITTFLYFQFSEYGGGIYFVCLVVDTLRLVAKYEIGGHKVMALKTRLIICKITLSYRILIIRIFLSYPTEIG